MAEWSKRFFAYLIDTLVLAIPSTIVLSTTTNSSVAANTNSLTGTSSFTTGTWIGLGLCFIIAIGYFAFLDGSRAGQTLGKRALGIAVRDVRTGGPIGAGRALGRRVFFFATYFLFILPFFLNALSPLWDARRQAWHDKVASSCVVRVR
ncbi:MAG: RDD family protein [Acidimicrobiales bacterium]